MTQITDGSDQSTNFPGAVPGTDVIGAAGGYFVMPFDLAAVG